MKLTLHIQASKPDAKKPSKTNAITLGKTVVKQLKTSGWVVEGTSSVVTCPDAGSPCTLTPLT